MQITNFLKLIILPILLNLFFKNCRYDFFQNINIFYFITGTPLLNAGRTIT